MLPDYDNLSFSTHDVPHCRFYVGFEMVGDVIAPGPKQGNERPGGLLRPLRLTARADLGGEHGTWRRHVWREQQTDEGTGPLPSSYGQAVGVGMAAFVHARRSMLLRVPQKPYSRGWHERFPSCRCVVTASHSLEHCRRQVSCKRMRLLGVIRPPTSKHEDGRVGL